MLLHGLSDWQPISSWPFSMSVNQTQCVPCRLIASARKRSPVWRCACIAGVRTNPYEVVKAGIAEPGPRPVWPAYRRGDILLVIQIAICAVLVTSSIVAVRGWRTLFTITSASLWKTHSSFRPTSPWQAIRAIACLRCSGRCSTRSKQFRASSQLPWLIRFPWEIRARLERFHRHDRRSDAIE